MNNVRKNKKFTIEIYIKKTEHYLNVMRLYLKIKKKSELIELLQFRVKYYSESLLNVKFNKYYRFY